MSILDGPKKINILVLSAVCFVLGLGLTVGGLKLSAFADGRMPVKIVKSNVVEIAERQIETTAKAGYDRQVVGSKNGKKYHLLDCPGAKAMTEKNKVFFETIALAESAGYSPAGNCKGLLK